MALSVSQQVKYWGIGIVITLFILWLLGGVLLPFIAGMAIAYFLDPVADRLEKMGFSRVSATVIITFIVLVSGLLLVSFLIPQLTQQISALAEAAPGYLETAKTYLASRFPSFFGDEASILRGLDGAVSVLKGKAGDFASAILASAFSIVDAIVFIVVAPVVAFYLLLDWDRMVETIDSWLPRDHLETLRMLAREVDQVLAGFVRGQMTVCAILGTFYAIALVMVGLQFGLVIGMLAGLLTFIPYVGSIIGGACAIGLALFQFWATPEWIVVVAIIFIAGQMIEGNFLTPKLVGGSVGLHPVWLMFALSAFGTLMGFSGMLVAVPVAASIGVFSRFALAQYLQGKLYIGFSQQNTAKPSPKVAEEEMNLEPPKPKKPATPKNKKKAPAKRAAKKVAKSTNG